MKKQTPCKYCGDYEEDCDCITENGIKGEEKINKKDLVKINDKNGTS